jgi:hypothetical protein
MFCYTATLEGALATVQEHDRIVPAWVLQAADAVPEIVLRDWLRRFAVRSWSEWPRGADPSMMQIRIIRSPRLGQDAIDKREIDELDFGNLDAGWRPAGKRG